MITVQDVSKSYGTRTLFDQVSVKFTPGNRYGLTGPNGAGKSTFMKILTGEIEPTNRGNGDSKPRKVGVLSQNQNAFDDQRIIDTVMMGNPALMERFGGAQHALRGGRVHRPHDGAPRRIGVFDRRRERL